MRTMTVLSLFFLTYCSVLYADNPLESYQWQKRVLLVFTPSLDHTTFKQQKDIIEEHKAAMVERDTVVWTLVHGATVLTETPSLSNLTSEEFYKKFHVMRDRFTVILLGKDGGEKLRKVDTVVGQKELFTLIDSMPMRQLEIDERRK